MRNVVLGGVDSRAQGELVVRRLGAMGISASVIARHRHHDHVSSGAAVGALIGIGVGIAVGFGVVVMPGIRTLVSAGPVLAAVSAAASIGLLFAIVGSALGLLLPEDEHDDTRWLVAGRVHPGERRMARDIVRAAGSGGGRGKTRGHRTAEA